MSVNEIVLGVDASEGTRVAIEWTAGLAAALDAHITAVHAFEPLAHLGEVREDHSFAEIRSSLEQTIRGSWCTPLDGAGVSYDVRIIDGEPGDVILEVAGDVDADLIVVGARRQGLVRALALGSTSQHVLHQARRPVTVIHSAEARS